MFVSPEMIACMRTLIGWRNHYDLVEIPALDPALNTTLSGEYYQNFHPALKLDYIKACLPPNRILSEYLMDRIDTGITQLLNDVCTKRKFAEYAKEILANDIILDKYGWSNDTIINENRFVGFKFKLNLELGLEMVVKNIGFQFSQIQVDLKIYVFHSSKVDPVTTFNLTTTKAIEWAWINQEIKLFTESVDIAGGVWVIGYYQEDIAGNAINYTDFNWSIGPCGTCDGVGSRRIDYWRKLTKFMNLEPFYVPQSAYGTKEEMFDLNMTINDYSKSWGMNFRISAQCNLSFFFCMHKMSFKNALGLKVAHLILEDMKFSNQINYIESALKNMIIRDLEGDKETNAINLVEKLEKAIEAVNFDHAKISQHCLPCNNTTGVSYGVA